MKSTTHGNVQAGIWVDHSHAILIELLPDGTERTRTFRSDIERGTRSGGGAHGRVGSHPITGANHLRLAERRRHALRNLYRRVWNAAADADRVVVLGPGLAPTELARAAPPGGGDRILGVEPLGQMTEAQLRAHVRDRFGHPAPRIVAGRGPVTAG